MKTNFTHTALTWIGTAIISTAPTAPMINSAFQLTTAVQKDARR